MVRHSEKHLIIILHPSSLSHNNHLNLLTLSPPFNSNSSRPARTSTELPAHVEVPGGPRIPQSARQRVPQQPHHRRAVPRIRDEAQQLSRGCRLPGRARVLPDVLPQRARERVRVGGAAAVHDGEVGAQHPLLRQPLLPRPGDPAGGGLAGALHPRRHPVPPLDRGRAAARLSRHARGQHARGEDRHDDGGHTAAAGDHRKVPRPAHLRGGAGVPEGRRAFQVR